MQEDLLQPFVTVEETMRIAAKLKLANKYSETDTRLLVGIYAKCFSINVIW